MIFLTQILAYIILLFLDLIKDVLPKGVINVVNGAGGKIGKHLVTHRDIKKVAFIQGDKIYIYNIVEGE